MLPQDNDQQSAQLALALRWEPHPPYSASSRFTSFIGAQSALTHLPAKPPARQQPTQQHAPNVFTQLCPCSRPTHLTERSFPRASVGRALPPSKEPLARSAPLEKTADPAGGRVHLESFSQIRKGSQFGVARRRQPMHTYLQRNCSSPVQRGAKRP